MLRERLARPSTVLAIAWLVLFLYGFPGQMMPDTYEHLIEARTGFYTDASPPVFTLLFAVSDWLFGGQVLVFLLQITAFVAGAYLTFRRLVPRHAPWLALAFCVFPPVLTPLAPVWKDALMPGLLLLGFGALGDPRRWVRVLALLALFGAIAIRYNAFAAAFPLVVLLFEWRAGMHWLKRTALALAAWVAITAGAYQANALLTDQEMHLWHSSLALFDIAGTLKNTPPIPDADLAPLLAGTGLSAERDLHARIVARYRPRNFFYLVEMPGAVWDVPIRGTVPAPAAQRDAIARAWREIVGAHRGAYLLHRARVFRECLALQGKTRAYWAVPERSYEYPWVAQEQGVSFHASPLQHALTDMFTWLWQHTPLFEPFVYFVLALVLLPVAARRHRDVTALLLSGIAIELTLFFLASSPDYRYSHWMVLCTILAAITLVARRARS